MIKGIIIVNNHGKPRLAKFYQSVTSEESQQSIIRRIFQQVASRPDSFCNYLEGSIPEWGSNIKLIYRHYATLYFVFAVDSKESDLGILDLIQVFVEALDKCFENVCELDLIFHSDRVHFVLDEIVMGGMVSNLYTEMNGESMKEIFAILVLLDHSDKVIVYSTHCDCCVSFLFVLVSNMKQIKVLETNINLILQAIDDQGKMHQKSIKGAKVNESAGTDTVRQQLGAGNQWA